MYLIICISILYKKQVEQYKTSSGTKLNFSGTK